MFRPIISKITSTLPLFVAAALLQASPSYASEKNADSLESQNKDLAKVISQIIADRPPVDDFGVVLANIHDFPTNLAKAAKTELKFNDRLQIVYVVKGSLADQLGLKPGDQLLQINSFYISRGEAAIKEFAERIDGGVDWNGEVNTTIIRNGFGQDHSNRDSKAKG